MEFEIPKNLRYIVGAYVATKSAREWDLEDETLFFHNLRQRPEIRGLEHVFYGQLHNHDESWFLDSVKENWEYVFTLLPGTMTAVKNNPAFGLASTDTVGRQQAIEFTYKALQAVEKLNHHHHRQSVLAVQIYTAPAGYGDPECFLRSLEEIAKWDWKETCLNIEHCDKYKPDGTHYKGFFDVQLEADLVAQFCEQHPQFKLGMTLNWARSVIENQKTETPLEHIHYLQNRNLLTGFIFSGTKNQLAGPELAYRDSHDPIPTPYAGQILSPHSAMTEPEILKIVQTLNLSDLSYFGFKVMPTPAARNYQESLLFIDHMIQTLSRVLQHRDLNS